MTKNHGSSAVAAAIARPFFIFLFAVLVSVGAPGVATAGDHTRHVNANSDGYAIDRYDPVAYFTEGRPVRGKTGLTAEFGGTKYAFASPGNRAKFLADPARYTPQYGGYCAYGVLHGSKSDIDPEVWEIVDGRLYFLLNAGTRSIWEKSKKSNIRIANKAWKFITGNN